MEGVFMKFLDWRKVDGAVRVIVKVQRTPQRWFYQWETNGNRRYSKRELLDIHMRVAKFVSRLPVRGRDHEAHTLWV
jgi:hypothetical protein